MSGASPPTSGTIVRPKIVVTSKDVSVPKLREIADVYQNGVDGDLNREKLLAKTKEADAIFCLAHDKIDKELLDNAKNLKVIGTLSVGYDHIDLAECKRRGIRIGYTPGVLTEATAELGVALLLATSRRILEAVKSAETGNCTTWHMSYFLCGKALQGSTVGIYGLGAIGASLAEKLVPFKPEKIIYNNRKPKSNVSEKFTYVSFEELLRESDFLVICAAATEENKGIFNAEAFAQMKGDAILINVARGSLVKLADLHEALVEKRLGAAGLDVTEVEPLPLDHPLFKLQNCVILPHIGSANYSTRNAMAATTENNIYNFFLGKPMTCELKF